MVNFEVVLGLRDSELRLRASGLFDAADMYRQFGEAFERGGIVSDVEWADRGRIAHLRYCFGVTE